MKNQFKVLIVDDEPNNLKLLQQILKEHYQLIFAPNGQKAVSAAEAHIPDLILLDIMMPDMNGYEVCQIIKANPQTQSIPVIFVTAMGELEDEAKGFDAGAVDYIQKPVSGPIVLRRVQTHLSLVRAQDLEELVKASILMLGEAGHYNDTDTGEHIWRMAAYSAAIARRIGWADHEVEMMQLSAPMHDTGKIGIPDSILKAPRQLTPQEWDLMQRHTNIGHNILSQSGNPIFKMAAEIALGHHEKWDGTGYPQGLKGEEIPESARIVAVADVFDALTMKRPYKDAWPLEKSLETMREKSGSHFEPRLVDAFFDVLDEIMEAKNKWCE